MELSMKLRIISSFLLLSLSSLAFAHSPETSGKCYIGAFGGTGSSNNFNASQLGTVYLFEIQGGPLSVNAVGPLKHHNATFFGAQLGYEAPGISLNASPWSLVPAAELEAYAMSKRSFEGNLINPTSRLAEQNFSVSYPVRKTVFLANAVLNFDHACLPIHPYVGFGIGTALVRVSGASSIQVSPAEANLNHYNTHSTDTISTFAGQIKLGLNYDIIENLSIFAEYRALYLANTHFLFGSTIATNHAETSPWQVKMNAQNYDLGSLGVRLNW